MYKSLRLIIIATVVLAGCKNNNIAINGKLLDSAKGGLIYLDELRSSDLKTVDSIRVSDDGRFTFRRKVLSSSFYLLKTDQSNFLTMLLEPDQNIEIRAYYDSLNYPISISGSKGTELMAEYNTHLRKTIRDLSGLYGLYTKKLGTPELKAVMNSIDSIAQIYLSEINAYTKKYIDENISSMVSLVALYQQVSPGVYILSPEKDLRYFVKVDSSLFKQFPDYGPVKSLHAQVQEMMAAYESGTESNPAQDINKAAPEISLPNPSGDTIKLSSTRGNIVLLDFWASWSKPCRNENPYLLKAYNMYHYRGFQIYQVSLDKTKDDWIKAINDDKIDRWIQVSDVKYWNSVVVPLYRIDTIPKNFLLDRQGNIIASRLRGDALQKKLAEIFNN